MELFGARGKLSGYGLAAAITFIWSVTFVSTKYLLGFLSPGEILLYRVAVAYTAFAAMEPHPLSCRGLKTELRIAGAGFLGITLYFLCENTALSFSAASNVALLCATAPLLTGILSHIFTSSEKISGRFAVGSIFCLVGIFFIVFNGHFILKLNPLGDMIALLAALSFAAFSVVIRDLKCDYTPVQIARKMLFYTLISLLLLAFTPAVELHPSNLLRPAVAGNVLFLGIFASAFCTWGWNIVIWKLGAVKANNLIYLTPPITMLFSALILSERITIFAIAGGLLILTGVYISQKMK
ncbi:MAG: DMT family transporter [Synergistaceae bacterium]|nr:DMT family transporter [Synergistaceae bacterium]